MRQQHPHSLALPSRTGLDALPSTLEWGAIVTVAVALPLVLRHPQPLVGVAVNAALVLGALRLRTWGRVLPLIVLPVLAALAGGMLFDEVLPAAGLALLVPCIWAGNAILVAATRGRGEAGAWQFAGSLAIGAAAKTATIAAGAVLAASVGLLDWRFVALFVPMQLLTAVVGGMLAWPADRALRRLDA